MVENNMREYRKWNSAIWRWINEDDNFWVSIFLEQVKCIEDAGRRVDQILKKKAGEKLKEQKQHTNQYMDVVEMRIIYQDKQIWIKKVIGVGTVYISFHHLAFSFLMPLFLFSFFFTLSDLNNIVMKENCVLVI